MCIYLRVQHCRQRQPVLLEEMRRSITLEHVMFFCFARSRSLDVISFDLDERRSSSNAQARRREFAVVVESVGIPRRRLHLGILMLSQTATDGSTYSICRGNQNREIWPSDAVASSSDGLSVPSSRRLGAEFRRLATGQRRRGAAEILERVTYT